MNIQPLQSEKFMKAVLEYAKPFKGSHLYNSTIRGHMEKTEQVDAGYGRWLRDLLIYLKRRFDLEEQPRILDLGCGAGELVVRMNTLGFDATGVDLHEEQLGFAKILAKENSLPETVFVLSKSNRLPFEDNSFDVVTLFSVLEHLSDAALEELLPELRRVCRGMVYILVPNRLKPRDDHTGLHFVSWMPRWAALLYIRLRGRKYQYYISRSGSWDVYYRWYRRIVKLFKKHGFDVAIPSDEVIYPPLEKCPPIFKIKGIPLPYKALVRLGYPIQSFYPYLNLGFILGKRAKR